jgi:hypothetical protein
VDRLDVQFDLDFQLLVNPHPDVHQVMLQFFHFDCLHPDFRDPLHWIALTVMSQIYNI